MKGVAASVPFVGSGPAEAILGNRLWHLADPERECTDDDIALVIADAVELADDHGIKWSSGCGKYPFT